MSFVTNLVFDWPQNNAMRYSTAQFRTVLHSSVYSLHEGPLALLIVVSGAGDGEVSKAREVCVGRVQQVVEAHALAAAQFPAAPQ